MKRKLLYPASLVAIAVPWLFLMEALPIPYGQISTAAEVTAEGIMFAALLAVVILLRKELRRAKSAGTKASRSITRVLLVFASLTLFLVGLVLVLIAVSFSL